MPNSMHKIRTTIDPHTDKQVEEMMGDHYGTKSSMVNKAINDLYEKHANTVQLSTSAHKMLRDYLQSIEGNQSVDQMASRIIIRFLKSQQNNEQDN